jgi:hypothetical protein
MATFACAVSYTIASGAVTIAFLAVRCGRPISSELVWIGLELQQKNTALPDRVGLGRQWTGDGKLQIFVTRYVNSEWGRLLHSSLLP